MSSLAGYVFGSFIALHHMASQASYMIVERFCAKPASVIPGKRGFAATKTTKKERLHWEGVGFRWMGLLLHAHTCLYIAELGCNQPAVLQFLTW